MFMLGVLGELWKVEIVIVFGIDVVFCVLVLMVRVKGVFVLLIMLLVVMI